MRKPIAEGGNLILKHGIGTDGTAKKEDNRSQFPAGGKSKKPIPGGLNL